MELLLNTFSAALTAAGLTLFIRAMIDWGGKRALLYKKPWGCNLCMAFWTSVASSIGLYWHDAIFLIFPAYFITYAALESFWVPPTPDNLLSSAGLDGEKN